MRVHVAMNGVCCGDCKVQRGTLGLERSWCKKSMYELRWCVVKKNFFRMNRRTANYEIPVSSTVLQSKSVDFFNF